MEATARERGWVWPVVASGVGVAVATTLALVHRLIDLGTYLLGGTYAFQSNLNHVIYPPTHLTFTYPPFAAVLFVPFAHLPLHFDQVGYTLLSLGALVGVIAVSLRAACPSFSRRTVMWWSLVLLTPVALLDPIRETLILGQINVILSLLVIVDMTVVPPHRRGYLVGLAAAIKLTPLILIPYLLLTRQRGGGLRALGTFVGVGLLSAAVTPQASWTYWRHLVWRPSGAGSLPWVGNQGLVGVVDRMMHHSVGAPWTFAMIAVVATGGTLIAVRVYRQSSPLLGLLVMAATESIASPVSWSHHFVWVVVLIAWLALASDRPAHGEWWTAAVVVLFWAAPIWWVPHGVGVRYAGSGWTMIPADSFFIALVVVVLGAVLRLLPRHRLPDSVVDLSEMPDGARSVVTPRP